MFPLSTEFWLIALFCGLFVFSIAAFMARSRWMALLPFVVGGAIFAWQIYEYYGKEYGSFVYGSVGLATLVVIGFAALWCFAAKRFTGAGRVAVAILPALAVAGFALHRQTVPFGACHEAIPVTIGERDYTLTPAFAPWIQARNPPDFALVSYRYAFAPDDKEDARRLCLLTKRGSVPLKAMEFRVTTESNIRDLDPRCAGADAPKYCSSDPKTMTDGQTRIRVIANRPDIAAYESRWMKNPSEGVVTSGTPFDGSRCFVGKQSAGTRGCAVWRQMPGDAMVIGEYSEISGRSREEVLEQIDHLIDFTLDTLGNGGQ